MPLLLFFGGIIRYHDLLCLTLGQALILPLILPHRPGATGSIAQRPKALNLPGAVRRPQASEVKGITGFTIGGVAPLGMTHLLPMVLDTSLRRFETIYAAGGHPNCIFPIAFTDLARISAAIISYNIASPSDGVQAYKPPLRRSKTLSASQN